MKVHKTNGILVQSVEVIKPKQVRRHRRARLRVWTPETRATLTAKKKAFWEWKQNNAFNKQSNILVSNKKLTTRYLRKLCRIVEESAVFGD